MRLISLFILFVSVHAFATIDDFSVHVPLEDGELLKACDNAFQQALADKIAYEAKPNVNLTCASQMSGSDELSVHDYFMNHCKNSTKASVEPGNDMVTVGAGVLQGNFDTAYGDIFRVKCLDSAVSAHYASGGDGGAAGVRDSSGGGNCHAFEGCR